MPFNSVRHQPLQIFATSTVKNVCVFRLLGVLFLLSPITAFSQQPRGHALPTGEPALVRPSGYSVQPSNGSTSTPTRAVEYRFQDSNTRLPPADDRAISNSTSSPVQPVSFIEPTRLSQPQTIPAASASQPSKLGSIALKPSDPNAKGDIKKPTNSIGSFLSVIFSMGIVISLFLGLAWVYKKSLPKSMGRLPHEVVQVLGRTSISPRQQMYVVRFGKKLLLVSQQPGQTQTLSEISDDEEVDRLTGMCESNLPSSSTQSFSEVLRQVATGQRTTDRRRSRTTA
ncbi:MAG: FliO/MopB family protein [Pirellula sp.]|jgi:flagellar protein FliO/FliZ